MFPFVSEILSGQVLSADDVQGADSETHQQGGEDTVEGIVPAAVRFAATAFPERQHLFTVALLRARFEERREIATPAAIARAVRAVGAAAAQGLVHAREAQTRHAPPDEFEGAPHVEVLGPCGQPLLSRGHGLAADELAAHLRSRLSRLFGHVHGASSTL